MREMRWSQIAPAVVGGLLLLEAGAMLIVAFVTFIIGGLVGMLAFVAGAGGATDEQIAQGFGMIALTLASPFVMTGVLGFGGVMLLLRWGRYVTVVASVVAILAQIAFHVYVDQGFHPAGLAPLALHVLAIVVAFAYVPVSKATVKGAPLAANPAAGG
jgi:hypothetical protein